MIWFPSIALQLVALQCYCKGFGISKLMGASVLGCICKRIDSTVDSFILQNNCLFLKGMSRTRSWSLFYFKSSNWINFKQAVDLVWVLPLWRFSWDGTRQDDFCMQKRLLNLKPSIYAEGISPWILPRVVPYLRMRIELVRLLPVVCPLGRWGRKSVWGQQQHSIWWSQHVSCFMCYILFFKKKQQRNSHCWSKSLD